MTVHLQMTVEVSTIRAYDQVDGYEKRRPYSAIVSVTQLTDSIVYLHGAVGKLDRSLWGEILHLLRERGVTQVLMERRGRVRAIDLQQYRK